jgi:hypothetical protein
MEAIRKFAIVEDNRITIQLPAGYNGIQVELIILPAQENSNQVNERQVDYFSKYYGSIKSSLREDQIDEKLKSLRDEWNRDI